MVGQNQRIRAFVHEIDFADFLAAQSPLGRRWVVPSDPASLDTSELVVNRPQHPTNNEPDHRGVHESDEAAHEGHPISGKELGEQHQVRTNLFATFEH